jgi:hypothetical protein
VLLVADRGGEIEWDVVAASGPSMVRFGAPTSGTLAAGLDAAVAGVAGGGDPRAGAGLGALNVRYLVVQPSGTSEALTRALAEQPALEPLPSGGGRVYRVRSWLPRAVVAPTGVAAALGTTGDPGNTVALEERGLRAAPGATYSGAAQAPGVLLLSEDAGGFQARSGDRPLEQTTTTVPLGEGVELPSWTVPEPQAVTVAPAPTTPHRVILALQLLLLLAVISLALRPPGFTQRREQRQRGANLPRQLTEQPRGGPDAYDIDRDEGTSPPDPGADLPLEPRP